MLIADVFHWRSRTASSATKSAQSSMISRRRLLLRLVSAFVRAMRLNGGTSVAEEPRVSLAGAGVCPSLITATPLHGCTHGRSRLSSNDLSSIQRLLPFRQRVGCLFVHNRPTMIQVMRVSIVLGCVLVLSGSIARFARADQTPPQATQETAEAAAEETPEEFECAPAPQGVVVPKKLHEGPSWPLNRGPLRVHRSGRFLEHKDGTPFLYLADTAWELSHRLTRDEVELYLDNRRARGFTVIQTVALAELEGLTDPNAYGDLPLRDKDPRRPAVKPGRQNDYWDHLEFVITQARKRGLYIALLPAWGNHVYDEPALFTPQTARRYGRWLARRLRRFDNLIWILGGDRLAQNEETGKDTRPVWRALAKGLRAGDGPKRRLMSFHPRGGRSSAEVFHNDKWLDFNMAQSGHSHPPAANYLLVARDYARSPIKPAFDGEPRYEHMPYSLKPGEPVFDYVDVRTAAYWNVLSGGFGHTYGANEIWMMWAPNRKKTAGGCMPWSEAISLPGAKHMLNLRRLLVSRPPEGRVPDYVMVDEDDFGDRHTRIVATRAPNGSYGMVYVPDGRSFEVNLATLGRLGPWPRRIRAHWYDPRTGDASLIDTYDVNKPHQDLIFDPPGEPGRGNDWVLVLDNEASNFAPPGQKDIWLNAK